jgi:L-alanine-DL-glutamate epimerase-like enolase superfamily enzyme
VDSFVSGCRSRCVITDVRVHTVALSEVEGGRADGTQDAAIIEVETDEGITGIGEADSSPAVVDAVVNAPVSHDKSAGLKTVVLGEDPFDVEVLWNEMFERSYFYGRKGAAITAISGIDMALWDVIGKATGKPLHKLIGGAHRESVRAYASTLFPADPTDTGTMRERARSALDDDFTAIKFGWGGFGDAFETDRELLGAARDALGEEFDLYWVEEPIYADNVDGVQPDVARSGGITHMTKIATLAREAGIPFFPHGYSTDIVVAAHRWRLAATENAPLLEYCVEDSPLRWDLVAEEFPVDADGRVQVPEDPGLGITIDWDTVEKYRTEF